jgi:peptide deformylase
MLYLRVFPDPILRRRCRNDFSIRFSDLDEMFALMRDSEGLGLAAPQVGIDACLFVTHWGEVFINPRIVAALNPYITTEGCLSLPKQIIRVQRYDTIRLADGRTFEGQQAQVIQHEIDHLDGVLVSDLRVKGSP